MQPCVTFVFKGFRFIYTKIRLVFNFLYTWVLFYTNNIKFKKFSTNGIPYIIVAQGGICIIGDNFKMNNGLLGNPIGRPQPCVLFVDKGAILKIGKNVGISATAIIAHKNITIGNNVKIGGGVCIYDTDFHSLDANVRNNQELDFNSKNNLSVSIGDNVFIGAHTTILKGVTIHENAIIGACSVVTKNIPANEIWAGNPARFIKNNNIHG